MSGVAPHTVAGGLGGNAALVGGRRKGVPVKTLKKMLKKAGLKVSGKKATLTRRAKKAHLKMKGGEGEEEDASAPAPVLTGEAAKDLEEMDGGRRRRSRKSKGSRKH